MWSAFLLLRCLSTVCYCDIAFACLLLVVVGVALRIWYCFVCLLVGVSLVRPDSSETSGAIFDHSIRFTRFRVSVHEWSLIALVLFSCATVPPVSRWLLSDAWIVEKRIFVPTDGMHSRYPLAAWPIFDCDSLTAAGGRLSRWTLKM